MLVFYNQRLYGKGGFSHHDVNQWGFTGAGTDYIMIRGLSAKLQANARGKKITIHLFQVVCPTPWSSISHMSKSRGLSQCAWTTRKPKKNSNLSVSTQTWVIVNWIYILLKRRPCTDFSEAKLILLPEAIVNWGHNMAVSYKLYDNAVWDQKREITFFGMFYDFFF